MPAVSLTATLSGRKSVRGVVRQVTWVPSLAAVRMLQARPLIITSASPSEADVGKPVPVTVISVFPSDDPWRGEMSVTTGVSSTR